MTTTITDGAVPLSRRKDKPLRQRDVAWLLKDGYRYYCRYCDTPHKDKTGRCCKRMVLDRI